MNVPDTVGTNTFLGKANNLTTSQAVVLKTNWGDSVFYMRSYGTSLGRINFVDGVQGPGNTIIAIGSFNGKELIVCQMDSNGQPLWINRYKFTSNNLNFYTGRYSYRNIVVSGSFIYLLTELSNSQFNNAILKLDLNGNIAWSKAFKKNIFGLSHTTNAITKSAGEVIVVSDIYETAGGIQSEYPVFTRINDLDGSIIESIAIKIPNDPIVKGLAVHNIHNNSDTGFTLIGQTCVLVSGNILQSGRAFTMSLKRNFEPIKGNWYEAGNYFTTYDVSENTKKALFFDSPFADKFFCIADEQENIYRTRRFIMPPALSNGFRKALYIDTKMNLHLLVNYIQNSKGNLEYIRLSDLAAANGASCFGDDTSIIQKFPLVITKENFPWDVEQSNVISQSPLAVTVQDETVMKEVVCKQVSYCDSLKIMGNSNFCFPGPNARFSTFLNRQCLKERAWIVDTSYAIVTRSEADSAITLQFKRAGSFYLKSFVKNCVVSDSVLITINAPQMSMQLTKTDSVLCPGKTVTLHVSQNFNSYLWQDGSSLPDYTVISPGWYKVTCTDNCGNQVADSVFIRMGDTTFQISSSYQICQFDSAQILIPSNIQNLSWQPLTTGIVSGRRLILYPSQTTNYLIIGRRDQGCDVQKTVTIVRKICPQWMKFPTAFTPNNDGKNDIFKPGSSGHPVEYKMKIFNRAGGLIFSSNNPAEGWSGKYKGEPQPSGIYVFLAEYKFGGEEKSQVKGTLVLIR